MFIINIITIIIIIVIIIDYYSRLSDRKKALAISKSAFALEDLKYDDHLPAQHDDVIKWKHFTRNWPIVTRSFDVFCDLRLNKRLSKQPWGWWFETPSWSLWRHCNDPGGDKDMELHILIVQ